MGGQFHSDGGEQNIAQGDHAIGKQENNHGLVISTTGDQAPAVNTQGDVTITYGVPFEKYEQVRDECERLKLEYGIRDAAFISFFRILNQENIPCAEWGAKLSEIAFRYKELLLRFEAVTSDDPQVKTLKEQAKQAIENGEYDRVDALLNQAKERDRAAVATLKASLAEQQAALEKRQLSEAQSCVDQAKLQRLQYRYEKAAQYFQEAAAALPEGRKVERAVYLGAAGYDFLFIACYTDALRLCEQSLSIYHDICDSKGQATSLNNISQIYKAQGEYGKTLKYLEQSLYIFQVFRDKEGEGATLNNIAMLFYANGDYHNALYYLEQSLMIAQNETCKNGEGVTLDNIGKIYYYQGNYTEALQYYKQALTVSREIKNRITESKVLNNIGQVYSAKKNYEVALEYSKQALVIIKEIGIKAEEAGISLNIGGLYVKQGDLVKAEPYLSLSVDLKEKLEAPDLKECREVLEAVRATLRGQETANTTSTVKCS